MTTHFRPGYLQKNGIPYSGNAILEEDFDMFSDPYGGNTWLTVASVVTDPQYLIERFLPMRASRRFPTIRDGTPRHAMPTSRADSISRECCSNVNFSP